MKWIEKSILFLLILVILLFLTSEAFKPDKNQSLGKVSERNRAAVGISMEEKNSIDLLVMGDSESYTSVSPMKLWKDTGIPAYVCGQPGQRVTETYYLLKTALKYQKPKVVFIETNLLYRGKNKIKELQHSITDMVKYYFSVFMYHNSWKSAIDGKGMTLTDYKGFQIRSNVSPYKGGEYMIENNAEKPIPDYVTGYFDDIIKLCREEGLTLVLYSVPSPANYNYSKHNGIKRFADENGLDYYDLNLFTDEIGIDWNTDSHDGGDHLNISGAHKLTEYLEKLIEGKYGLKDRREDKKYREWDELEKDYNKRVTPVIENIQNRG